MKNMTIEEAWGGFKSSVDHFKVFRYVVYANVLDDKRTKLDIRVCSVFCLESVKNQSHTDYMIQFLEDNNK